MSNLDDMDHQFSLENLVNHSVIADSNTPEILFPSKLFASGGPRVIAQG